jgi:hypothetical protein
MGYKEEGRGKYWFGSLWKTFGSTEREESVLVGGGWRVEGLDALLCRDVQSMKIFCHVPRHVNSR